MDRINIGGVKPARELAAFVNEVLAGTALTPEAFWTGFAGIVADLGPRNRALLAERARLKSAIDEWHRSRRGQVFELAPYQAFLKEIGYLVPEPGTVASKPTMSTPKSPASPDRNSSCRCRTPAMRSTPRTRAGAVSTTRFTAPTPSPRTAAARAAAPSIRRAAPRGGASARRSSTRHAPLAGGRTRMRPPTRSKAASSWSRLAERRRTGLADPGSFAGYQRRARRADRGAAAQPRPARRDPIDRTHPVGTRRSRPASATS